MALAVILHRVKDYDAWRKVYDEVAPLRKAGGVTAESVNRAKDDPTNILVLQHFETMAAAEAFFARTEVREVRQRAGVEGMPRIELYEETE